MKYYTTLIEQRHFLEAVRNCRSIGCLNAPRWHLDLDRPVIAVIKTVIAVYAVRGMNLCPIACDDYNPQDRNSIF
ncbi:hypothetical protein CEXT_519391 [Caerostris extrusa]|uniref:Uncharacterized protein n=1 Tax=Caerostris extrusa TaxID=172846 RepID=A0AAV4VZM7_CAEEX|nr:hypothetical protein CEXT_519391 [Caerostris extrusa]